MCKSQHGLRNLLQIFGIFYTFVHMPSVKEKQLSLFKKGSQAFGGTLFKKRKGRAHPRPLYTRYTMHLVLRSQKAKGEWSFKRAKNETQIKDLVKKFAERHGVRILTMANVGNHLHFQMKLSNRYTYPRFIRALSAAIAMKITGCNRWSRKKYKEKFGEKLKFWDYRPFTRIIQSYRALLRLRDYIAINQLEGLGYAREKARFIVAWDAHLASGADTS